MEHGSITVVLCVNYQNAFMNEMDDLDEWDFMGLEFKIVQSSKRVIKRKYGQN